ncbi:LuxR C-terminal-related transcriptional regulator [Mycolicibacterium goodii]|uniref:histidine kinase n=1 Tax=Mycolicibacterium goodii TaxID=134601 RepID=A0ABS6I0H1_MYCGD|nr:LuxR C-terminal-related transcriptional regulator [Mycolicibacterium goodii]MBU8827695.1 LuxR C-terminal-related transcriptional regulator [Mycolicibacterium goodii]MBU8841484.1 LuxR C-terminal-related transcriptional regulator [Mycolicibacterium goodii]
MTTDQGESPPAPAMTSDEATVLSAIVGDIGQDIAPAAALESILARCIRLMGCDAGSVSSVDETAGTYRKEVDIGVRCLSGQVFPINEGMTGEIIRRRSAVWFDRYDEVPGGHLDTSNRNAFGATIGAPLEWRGRVIGACVVFSRDSRRRFGPDDAQLLGMYARHAAAALANATMHEAIETYTQKKAAGAERARVLGEVEVVLQQARTDTLGRIDADGQDPLRKTVQDGFDKAMSAVRELACPGGEDRDLEAQLRVELATLESIRSIRTQLVVTGNPFALSSVVVDGAMRVLSEILDNVMRHAAARTVRVLVAYEHAVLRLIVQDDGQGFATEQLAVTAGPGQARIVNWVRELGGDVAFESEPNWGTSVRLRFPQRLSHGSSALRIPVVVAAPKQIVTAGLARLLAWEEPLLAVVGECRTIDDVISQVHRSRPAVTVVSHDDPLQLVEWVRRAADLHAEGAVVAVCPDGNYDLVSEVVLAGAAGCFVDTADGATAASVVVAVANGMTVLPDYTPRPRNGVYEELTSREREVRHLVERGMGNKAIADELFISVKTVEKHVGAILRKTGLRSRNEVVARTRAAAR